MLLIKLWIQVFQICKGQFFGEASFTQDQVAHSFLDDVAEGTAETAVIDFEPTLSNTALHTFIPTRQREQGT